MSTTQEVKKLDLTPVSLKDNIVQLGSDTLRAQGQSLVLLRQVPLNIIDDALNIAEDTANHQRTVNSFANFYLNTIQPKAIGVITDVSALTNLIKALQVVKVVEVPDLENLIKSILNRIDDFRLKNSDYIEQLSLFSKNSTNELATFKKEIEDVIASLEGDTGAISQAKEAISQTSAMLDKNIQEIIDNSNVIGDGIKDLVTYALTVITSSSSKTPEKEKSGDEKAEKKDPAKEEKFDPFPVESIGAVSNGVSGVSEAVAAYRKNLEKIGILYQDLAELNALLSALTAIEEQSSTYSSMINSILTDIETYDQSMKIIADNYSSALNALSTGDLTPADFEAILTESLKYWDNLNNNITEVEAAMVGKGQLFPQVQSI